MRSTTVPRPPRRWSASRTPSRNCWSAPSPKRRSWRPCGRSAACGSPTHRSWKSGRSEMKVCYVDESGNGEQDRCLVMVGIVVDALRLNRTREEFNEVFDVVQSLFQENLRELKGAKIIF